MKTRLTLEQYMLNIAYTASLRATCPRKRVGCVLTDKHHHIQAVGYNGTPRGMKHCIDVDCGGAADGQPLEACMATHAEQNALLQCRDVQSISAVFCTLSPCIHCIKLLMNTSATDIYVLGEYKDPRPKDLWLSSQIKRTWHVMHGNTEGLPFVL